LGVSLLIAQLTFHFYPTVSLSQHVRIVTALGTWALLSVVCQWALDRERWSHFVPFVWATLDVTSLTVVLWLDEAGAGPLVAAFPVLVATSGLWFREAVVGMTTALTMLGYGVLVSNGAIRTHHIEQLNWHIAFLVFLALAGFAVAYQVHRVRALSRFYGRPDQAERRNALD
jgi:serine/threonine-protein kinase